MKAAIPAGAFANRVAIPGPSPGFRLKNKYQKGARRRRFVEFRVFTFWRESLDWARRHPRPFRGGWKRRFPFYLRKKAPKPDLSLKRDLFLLKNHPYVQPQTPRFLLEDAEGIDIDLADFREIAEKLRKAQERLDDRFQIRGF